MHYLLKFGKREHLEQLKQGIVHFSPIELFQEDPTNFRGDRMEGKDYIDLSKPFIVNGLDISGYMKEAVISYKPDCGVYSFSASLLSTHNCHLAEDDIYALNDDFIEEMKQFGYYFLIINLTDFISTLSRELEEAQVGYECRLVTYVDKHDSEAVRKYYDNLDEFGRQSAYLFLKDVANSYSLQYEWRFVLFDHDNCYGSICGSNGINLHTKYSTKAPVLHVDTLKGLRCDKECLEDDERNET